MNIALFYHSLISDWNHGNAHFLRGIVTELMARGHTVTVYEPEQGWSLQNLLKQHGEEPVSSFHRRFPHLQSRFYRPERFDPEEVLVDADLVIVHEWNDPDLVSRIGTYRRKRPDLRLLFHDTHHRMVTRPEEMAAYDLSGYDGVLAFGESIRDLYRLRGKTPGAWTWHEAADTRTFHPLSRGKEIIDLVWIGNWGDEERTAEYREFLIEPVRQLGLTAVAYGVQYPDDAIAELAAAGIDYRGWLPNYRVPEVFARSKMTLHIPRGPYAEALPGIPTIRPFEALACGIPLVCSMWRDSEGLFTPGEDFLMAADGGEMKRRLERLISDGGLRRNLSENGLRTILTRHTCSHRTDQLMDICRSMALSPGAASPGNATDLN